MKYYITQLEQLFAGIPDYGFGSFDALDDSFTDYKLLLLEINGLNSKWATATNVLMDEVSNISSLMIFIKESTTKEERKECFNKASNELCYAVESLVCILSGDSKLRPGSR